MTDAPDIEARAVRDARDFPLLFDLWVNGQWIGSRRTVEQCEQALSRHCGTPVEATYGSAW